MKNHMLYCLLFSCSLTAFADTPSYTIIKPSYIITATKHDTSLPWREIKTAPNAQTHLRIIPKRLLPPNFTTTINTLIDEVLQTSNATVSDVTFATYTGIGVGLGNYTPYAAPPDTNGAVGLTQYVQIVNDAFAVFNKTTGAVISGYPKSANSLWQGFGGLCETHNDGDVSVTYDTIANRWIVVNSAWAGSNEPAGNYACVAVSTTSDATGAYYRYSFPFSEFNDYGKISAWPDAYYYTTPIFGANYQGPTVCALNRTAMLAGNTASAQCTSLGPQYGIALAADKNGSTALPAGSPQFLMTLGYNQLLVFRNHVDWNNPANSFIDGPFALNVAAFSYGTSAPQPNSSTQLDASGDRLMYRLSYRQFPTYGAMVVTHTIQGPNNLPQVRWYEVHISNDGKFTPSLYQQGTYAPDPTIARFVGSTALDKKGNMAIGYSVSSSTLFPSIAIATRKATDPVGTLAAENIVVKGTGSQGMNRWGDYSAMHVDPVDECTFWYTTEYLKTSGSFNWSTSLIKFKIPGCSGGRIPI
jgi:hypothetical protein